TLLDTYEIERAPHVRQIVETAVEYGRLTCITDEAEAAARDEAWLADPRSVTERIPFRLPSLRPGPLVLEGGGDLFIQPRGEGSPPLDDIVGQRFLVLGRDEEALGTTQDWWMSSVGALVVTIDALPRGDELDSWLRAR